ncbi:MAG: HAD family hydrolase [Bdellovibrionales bacterium]|nr:HAD family hydrolase [Bdellovibrionales bacterium]
MGSSKPQRLVLFDIDGTLLRAGPMWTESYLGAVAEVFPDFKPEKVRFGGKTDFQICKEILRDFGIPDPVIDELAPAIIHRYLEKAGSLLSSRGQEMKLLPGVVELLKALSEHPDVSLGILTGNVRKGAQMKLSHAGLLEHFSDEDAATDLLGAFGDDHWNRYELPRVAVARAFHTTGVDFSGKEVVVIGDTEHDVNCGKSIGVRSIAVGTGRDVPKELILAHKPDYFFENLSATQEVVRAILCE